MINQIYQKLRNHYGPQLSWWPGESEIEIIVGAILTQNTNWKNVEIALGNLRSQLTYQKLEQLSTEKLKKLITPSGFFNRKAQTIKSFLAWFEGYQYDSETLFKTFSLEKIRQEILAIHGIGAETADSILLYAFKKPVFVIDAYTKRLFAKMNLPQFKTYDEYQRYITDEIAINVLLYQEYHGLIVMYAKDYLSVKKNSNK